MEARHERARQQESARQEIKGYVAEHRTMEAQARHHDKVAAAAAAREAQEREFEEGQIAAWRAAQEQQEAARQRLEEERQAAAEAEERGREAARHQREVQLLLERSGELRELKEKLRAAEVNLGRVQQREQRAAIEQREREYSAALEALMSQQREAAAAREAREAEQRRRAGAEARRGLDQQVQERRELQRVAKVGWQAGGQASRWVGRWAVQCACGKASAMLANLVCAACGCVVQPPAVCKVWHTCIALCSAVLPIHPLPLLHQPRPLQEEFERERAMVDAVVRRIEEEEAEEEEARQRRQRGAQADIQRFLAQQQELKKRWAGGSWRAGWCAGWRAE